MLSAIAIFQGKINGSVTFTEYPNHMDIIINLNGLKKNALHGFHVHEYGDLSDGCNSACAHFNPYNKTHGCMGMKDRHVGDLGNIVSDMFGNATYLTYDDTIRLSGKCNIIGRMLIIHADPDDCGMGQNERKLESLKTGNAGKRIACAVIGYKKINEL